MKLCSIGSRGHYQYVFNDLSHLSFVELVGISSGCNDSLTPLVEASKEIGLEPRSYHGFFF
jgi:hypothetical protein